MEIPTKKTSSRFKLNFDFDKSKKLSNEQFNTMILNNNDTFVVEPYAEYLGGVDCKLAKVGDSIYSDIFSDVSKKDQYIYTAQKNEQVAFFIVKKKNLNGCIISQQQTVEFTLSVNKPTKSTIRKNLESGFPTYSKFKSINATDTIINNLVIFNKNFIFSVKKMNIGLVYAKNGQTDPLIMMRNTQNDVSKEYSYFTELLGVPDVYDEANKFDDVFNDKVEICWHQATTMTKELQRTYIANDICIIIYKESAEPFITENALKFGKVSQIFIVVEKSGDSGYKLGVFHKKMKQFDPLIPKNYVFNGENLREFILMKIYNGLIALQENSTISTLYLTPREENLKKMASTIYKIEI